MATPAQAPTASPHREGGLPAGTAPTGTRLVDLNRGGARLPEPADVAAGAASDARPAARRSRQGRTRTMSEQRELEGVTALVTGATSGIGRAAAEQLGRHGADVIVHGRDPARGGAVAGAITAPGRTPPCAARALRGPAAL